MREIVLALILMLALPVAGQQVDDADSGGLFGVFPAAGSLTVEMLEAVHSNGTLYRFPRIGGDSPAATRINTYLQTQLLDGVPAHDNESLFAQVWPEQGTNNGLVSLDYTLSFEQPGILTVQVFREFYGAYFTSTLDTYHFDADTGQLISLRHLLTPEGLARVDAEIRDRRLQQIDDFISGKDVDGTRLRSDPLEAEEQQLLYQECRSFIDKELAILDDAFRLGRYSYELIREPCGPRVQWALLDLDLNADRSFEMEQELLSEYGRCLLIERRARCARGEGGLTPGVYLGGTAENPVPVVIIEGRTGVEAPSGGSPDEPAVDGSRWETSPPVLQAIAAARSYWSAEKPDFQEKLRVWGSASGAFTRAGVEQHAVLFMMSNIPHCCPPMGLAIVEGDRLVRNIAVVTIAQSIRAMPDINSDGRDELVFGGGFMGQGLVTESVTLAAFGEGGLDDFGKAITFESACDSGYEDSGAFAARLSVVPGAEIIVEHYRQPSCDSETWEPVGEPEPLQPIPGNEKTVYTEIPLGVTTTN